MIPPRCGPQSRCVETEGGRAGAGRNGDGELALDGGRVSVRDEEKVQWLHGGNECPAV